MTQYDVSVCGASKQIGLTDFLYFIVHVKPTVLSLSDVHLCNAPCNSSVRLHRL